MKNILDKILEEQGLKYEDLNSAERETYRKAQFESKVLTLADLKEYIQAMKDSIALQLCDTPDDTENLDKNRKLKARLKNYVLIEAFLTAPEKAEKAMARALEKTKQS